ncbi:MAG TPA: hypothetical protein VKB31_08805 [Trueperaceae bacterium]|nr:hypothetical protein [Trueperaceae bacterium]
MSNQVYQTTVEELEAILSPRVVSRSLQEGLRQLGRSPDTVDFAAVEKILKAQIYRQLQVTMPVMQAKEKIESILGRLQEVHGDGAQAVSADAGLTRQRERLEQLKAALKPFNLYFEWPEVQKLRAQIQLLENEQEAEREATSLADDAEAQLHIVEQKLEDQLVIQARELGELSEALEQVRSLGGPKVRRLENLVNQIGSAQQGRQLAPAEIERTRRLARDLRKLVESSVYAEEMEAEGGTAAESHPRAGDAAPVAAADGAGEGGVLDVESEEEDLLSIDTADLAPEVSARLLLLDLEDERHDLEQLAAENMGLLEYQPSLHDRFDALRAKLDADASIAEDLEALRATLADAFDTHRQALQGELQGIEASLADIRPDVDNSELRQALGVTLGILATTLPNQADVQHARNLHRLALEQVEALERAEDEARAQQEAQLADQAALLERLRVTLERYRDHGDVDAYRELEAEVRGLASAHDQQLIDAAVIDRARRAEASLESRMAQLADEQVDRQRAGLRNLLAQVKALPALDTVAARISSVVAEIERQLEDLDGSTLDDAQLDATAALVDTLRGEVTATLRRRLEVLAEQAGELSSPPLLERIRAANDGLETGDYPDLAALRAAIKQEREAERSEQIGELHRLEREAARFAGMEGPTLSALQEHLVGARERIDQGLLAPGLPQAWSLLERLQADAEQRLRNVFPRLDVALEAFRPVEKLNSDDVATVRRILRHLDSQREAFERVSVGLQLQLEASLREAEALLEKLGEEYEATRVIADQLVSANVLDDVLGFLGEGAASAAPPPPAGGSAPPPDVAALLDPYLHEAEVTGAALLSADGTTLGGRLPFDGAPAAALVTALRGAAEQGASTLGAWPVRIATFEYDGAALLAAWPTHEHTLLLSLRSSSDVALLSGRLRRDLDGLAEALGGAQGGPAHA